MPSEACHLHQIDFEATDCCLEIRCLCLGSAVNPLRLLLRRLAYLRDLLFVLAFFGRQLGSHPRHLFLVIIVASSELRLYAGNRLLMLDIL